jgi:hypothetical protein
MPPQQAVRTDDEDVHDKEETGGMECRLLMVAIHVPETTMNIQPKQLHTALATHASGAMKRAMVSGGLAGLFSLVTLAVRGRQELKSAAAPLNAPSHWVHGQEALAQNRPTLRHTVPGVLIHQASGVFWGLLFDQVWQRVVRRAPREATTSLPVVALGAASLTAVAALVDLKMVPDRLTPGFQKRLSSKGTAMVYVSFAVGLAAGAALLMRHRDQGQGQGQG